MDLIEPQHEHLNEALFGEDWSPPSGLGWALGFKGGIATVLDEATVDDPSFDWRWLHYRLGDVRAQIALRSIDDLPPAAARMFALKEDRIAIDQQEDWVFGVLPDLERDLSGIPLRDARLVFAVKGGRMITGRLHALRAVDDVRRLAERGVAIDGPGVALTAIIEGYTDVIETILDQAGARLSVIEDYVLTEPQDPRSTDLSRERRRLARLRRELQGLRSALVRALGGRRGDRVDLLSEALPNLISLVEDMDHEAASLQDRGRLLHEEIDTLFNAATNRSMRTLTIITTLLVPPTVIVGAFGMNVPGIPWDKSPAGFALAVGLCGVSVVGALWLLRRMQMLP